MRVHNNTNQAYYKAPHIDICYIINIHIMHEKLQYLHSNNIMYEYQLKYITSMFT